MKAIFTRIILSGIMTGAFLSCDTKKTDSPNEVTYDSLSVSRIYHMDNDSTKPSCTVKVKYIFPVKYSDAEVLSKIRRELNYAILEDESYESLSPDSAVEKYAADYIKNYIDEAKVQFPDWVESDETEDYYSFYKSIESKVLYDKNKLLSYQVSTMDYKGGANSSTLYKNVVLDLKTGNVVTEQDIFIPDYKGVLNAMLTNKIVDQNNVKKAEELLEFGYWGIEDITSNNNFYLDDNGLAYIFNQGEYSAPSLGKIEVPFSFEELSAILKPDSPISFLFKQ
ncbi:MAG: RsiV family protein [Prevotella sp.]|nr:RsiV family protein [Prevotella sp.]